MMRTMLDEAAQSMLFHSTRWSSGGRAFPDAIRSLPLAKAEEFRIAPQSSAASSPSRFIATAAVRS